MSRRAAAVLFISLGLWGQVPADESLLLCGFESDSEVRAWEYRAGTPRLVAEGHTQGQRAVEIAFDPKGRYHPAYIYWRRVRRDWSPYDALALDVYNPNPEPIPGYILVADEAWRQKGRTYWNRHNASRTFPPGHTTWTIPVRGLYRGEAGSRNNDIKRNIDPDQIVRVDFGFGRRGTTGRVIIDNLRLVKATKPPGVWVFDFGPPSQPLMLGWTPVTWNTRYTKARGYGWGPRGGTPWNGAARDTTFPTPLLQDFCEAGGYNFHLDVPPGKYRVTVFYENCGYWGGEQARHTWRRILVGGREVWREHRTDGPAHPLYRFENLEPVGVDIWDTYMKPEIAKPAALEAEAGPDGLTLRFEADTVWGSKVAAIALHRAGDPDAEKWLSDQIAKVAAEFRSRAVCLDKPAPDFEVSDEWKKLGFVAWPVRLQDAIGPNSTPPENTPSPSRIALEALAARGESECLALAIRPTNVTGEALLEFRWTRAPAPLPARVVRVWYNTSRGFGQIAYRIRPHTLRPAAALPMTTDVTREVFLKVRIPPQAPPGDYLGQLSVSTLKIPVRVRVSPVALDRDTDFLMGFFGLMPPGLIPREKRWGVLDQTLEMLRESGMNAVCGGPSWSLKGWKNGEPIIDFGHCDRFFALLRKHGFTGAICGYGGLRFRGLHDRYEKGKTGERVERQSGLPYEEALMRAWKAVDAHARANNWPTIYYAMCDETRVREVAERELAFMKMMAKVSATYPRTIRTSGSYSVHFRSRPASPNDMLFWHQRFFEALDISSLNLHDQTVMAEAKRLGKEIHIYNQGRSRYSFGLYQWSEFRKGVKARWQWHLNILHGYQFFDLDGREPDTAMVCYGRNATYPTIHFERCREGAEDFYLYNTLRKTLQATRRGGPAVQAARRLLASHEESVRLNQRQPPPGYDPDAAKAALIAAIERLIGP